MEPSASKVEARAVEDEAKQSAADAASSQQQAMEHEPAILPPALAADSSTVDPADPRFRIIDAMLPPSPPAEDANPRVAARFREYRRLSQQGHNLTQILKAKKDFNNPCLLELTIERFGIEDGASAFPPSLQPSHDPSCDNYRAIAEAQAKVEKERQERQRPGQRWQIAFVPPSASAAAAASSSSSAAGGAGATGNISDAALAAAVAKAKAQAAAASLSLSSGGAGQHR